jgi:hypothetical protein
MIPANSPAKSAILALPLAAVACALLSAACATSVGGGGSCAQGTTQACVGPAQCNGVQICLPDAGGWSVCDCSNGFGGGGFGAGGGSGATSGAGATGGFGGAGATGGFGGSGGFGAAGATGGSGGTSAAGGACSTVLEGLTCTQVQSTDPSADACMKGSCCSVIDACFDDPGCADFLACMSQCTDSNGCGCEACFGGSATASALLDDYVACMDDCVNAGSGGGSSGGGGGSGGCSGGCGVDCSAFGLSCCGCSCC